MDKKALRFAIIGLAVIAAVVAGVFFGSGIIDAKNKKNETIKNEQVAINTDEEISHTDAETVKLKASQIFSKVAEFGYQVEPEERNAVLQSSESSFIKRKAAFDEIKAEISTKSPLYYSVDKLNSWDDSFELLYLIRNQLQDISIDLDKNYSLTTLPGNEQLKSIKGNIKVSSKTSYVIPYEDDRLDWDGTHRVYERDFINDIEITFIQDKDGEWKLYQANGADNPWILAIDKDPDINKYRNNLSQSNFKNIGSFKAEVPDSMSSSFIEDE